MNRKTILLPRGRGFTLIELLVVIVLIVMLAALALPRYLEMASPARAAKARAAYGAIRSAAALAKSQCLVGGGGCQGAAGSLVMEGATIPMAYAYPAADGIQAAAGLSSSDYEVMPGNPVTFAVPGAKGACRVIYAQAVAPNTTPTITLDVDGC